MAFHETVFQLVLTLLLVLYQLPSCNSYTNTNPWSTRHSSSLCSPSYPYSHSIPFMVKRSWSAMEPDQDVERRTDGDADGEIATSHGIANGSANVNGKDNAPSKKKKPRKKSKKKPTSEAAVKLEAEAEAKADPNETKRIEQLTTLSQQMKMDVPTLKQALKNQRKNMDGSQDRAKLIDFLIYPEVVQGLEEVTGKKKKNKNQRKKKSGDAPQDGDETQRDTTQSTSTQSKRTAIRPKRPTQATSTSNETNESVIQQKPQPIIDPTLLSTITFQERNDLHPATKRALIEGFQHSTMTEIQAKTYAPASQGQDVVGLARTGTGKTLAFLLPALERILFLDYDKHAAQGHVRILIISPTRELATQIGDQAEKLCAYHMKDRKLTTMVLYGGVKIQKQVNRLNKNMPTILVATPGRLLDHLKETKLHHGKKFGDVIKNGGTSVVVLDEFDRMIDQGFQREMDLIRGYFPRTEQRQTLLFSATYDKSLEGNMRQYLRPNFVKVDCIGLADGKGNINSDSPQATNQQVVQTYARIPDDSRYLMSLIEVVQWAMMDEDDSAQKSGFVKQTNNKIVVFFPVARMVSYFSDIFRALGLNVVEMHSRKSQSHRNKASEQFRQANSGVMFTSDVSARGVDYPNVSHVIQFGMPEKKEQYIHRLGRTGRAGKAGKGVIVLASYEMRFKNQQLKDLDIDKNTEIEKMLYKPVNRKITNLMEEKVFSRVKQGDKQLIKSSIQCYQAFLGYYNTMFKKHTTLKSKEDVVATANRFSALMGLPRPPGLLAKTVGLMHMKGIKGITVVKPNDFEKQYHK